MGQWWESLKKTCKWQKWVLAGCQKCSTTARKKFKWPALKKCWQDTHWSAFSGEAGHYGWGMDPPVQSRNKKAVKTMETFRLATLKKIPSWRACRENSLFNFLGPERRYSLISSPKGHDHHRRMLQRHFEESVVACSCRKATWIGGELHPPSRQHSTTQGSNYHRIPGGTGNWDTLTSSLFTWPCSERFLVVWPPETLSPRKTVSFEIKSRFSSLPVSKIHT